MLKGLDPADFAAHSLRSGFLTSAAEAGAEVLGHRSMDTLRRYVRRANLFKAHAGAGVLVIWNRATGAVFRHVRPSFALNSARGKIVRAGPRQERTCARAFSRTSPERCLAFPCDFNKH